MKKILLFVLMLAVGCAPWVEVGGIYKTESHNFSVELPQGWMRWNQGDDLIITRDGVLLQNIQVVRPNIKDPLKYTKKKFSNGMLPHEVAEIILDDVASNQAILGFQLIENTSIEICGFSGFRAIYTYKNKGGLKIKSVYCGFMADPWFYGLNYNAAERYYFEKDIQTFERVFKSFKLIKTA